MATLPDRTTATDGSLLESGRSISVPPSAGANRYPPNSIPTSASCLAA